MAIPNKHNAKENLDIPRGAPPVNRQPERAIQADNKAGEELSKSKYVRNLES